jgi:hypothetical protein
MPMNAVTLPTWYYEQGDADYSLDVPAKAYGGWQQANLPLSLEHTAVVCMHAWDCGTREEFPGWYRVVEYIPRADAICREVFPRLFDAVRKSPLPLFHVVGGGNYYKDLPGYKHAVEMAELAPAPAPLEQTLEDPVHDKLRALECGPFQNAEHNRADIRRGFKRIDFAPNARPLGDEGVAENASQLFALCREANVNHLIYAGFAINYCLLLSAGGMVDMSRRGLICSAIRQATTAVENKESAREEFGKQMGLWRVARMFGFVYDLGDFTGAIKQEK